MTVGARVTVVRAVDVTAWDVVVLVLAAVRQNARSGKFPLAEKERFGRVGGVDGPDVARVVGVGAVFWGDHGQVSPVDAKDRVLGARTALCIPGVDRVELCCAVAQKMVVRNGVVNPAVAVESPGASTPLFGGHVGVSTTVGPVPSVVSARATEPSADFVVLRP